jgi:hypothetical protein
VDPAAPDRVLGSTDLLVDPIRILAAPDAPPDAAARHRAWYGVLQSALETEHALAAAANLDAATVELVSASIGAADAPPTVLAPGSEVSSGAPGRLRAAVAAGFTVVVTGDPAAARAWWEFAEDGTVRAILAPSLGGVRRVGGPRPPAIPRVTPPQQTPNQLPQRPQPQPQKPPARTPTRPPVGKPVCTGNEQTILQRCVAFFARFAVSELVVAGIMAAVSIASLYVLGRLIAGG